MALLVSSNVLHRDVKIIYVLMTSQSVFIKYTLFLHRELGFIPIYPSSPRGT